MNISVSAACFLYPANEWSQRPNAFVRFGARALMKDTSDSSPEKYAVQIHAEVNKIVAVFLRSGKCSSKSKMCKS